MRSRYIFHLVCLVVFGVLMWSLYRRDKKMKSKIWHEDGMPMYDNNNIQEVRKDMEDMISYGLLMSHEVPLDKSIFFLDFSGRNFLSPSVACAVESASRQIPHFSVFVLLTSKDISLEDSATLSLFAVPNIKYRQVEPNLYFSKVHLSDWYKMESKSGKGLKSFTPHLKLALKFALLHYHGGIVIDTDVMLFRDVSNFPNFLGLQEPNVVSSSIMKFQEKHIFLENILREFPTRIERYKRNGVDLLSEYLRDICHVELLSQLHNSDCQDVPIVYPTSHFFPVPFDKKSIVFDPLRSSLVLSRVKDSYALKTWLENDGLSPSSNKKKKRGPNAFQFLAKEHCPMVYFSTNANF